MGLAVKAELGKMFRTGGIRIRVIVTIVMGILAGLFTLLMSIEAALGSALSLSDGSIASAGQSVAAPLLCLTAAAYVTTEISDGTILISRLVMPASSRLFVARMLAWMLVSVIVSVVIFLPLEGASLLYAGVPKTGPVKVLMNLMIGTAVTAAITAIAIGAALVLRKGAYVVAAAGLVLFVLPFTLIITAALVPEIAQVARTLNSGMLGAALLEARWIPADPSGLWSALLQGWAVLSGWVVVVLSAAHRSYTRPGFGDR